MKKCSRSTARSTTWSKLLLVAAACWVTASRVASWGSAVVWAGVVWANRDVVQQTRESVRSANRERNIFVCFISPQGVLRLNGRELLFGEAKRLVGNKFTPLADCCNRQASPFGVM